MAFSRRTERILHELRSLYPDAVAGLDWNTPFQLLVATVLSAQSTDRGVNRITPALFERFPDAKEMAGARSEEEATGPDDPDCIACYIRSLGLYHTKARHLRALAQALVDRMAGEVPRERALLLTLPGVGRKTANVVLANAFGVPALAVDTHVGRVSRRLGLAKSTDPDRVEAELCRRIPRQDWIWAHHALIAHGRVVCHARRPACDACTLVADCPWGRIASASRAARRGPDAQAGAGSPRAMG